MRENEQSMDEQFMLCFEFPNTIQNDFPKPNASVRGSKRRGQFVWNFLRWGSHAGVVAVKLMSVFIYNHLSLFFRKPHNEPLNASFCITSIWYYFLLPQRLYYFSLCVISMGPGAVLRMKPKQWNFKWSVCQVWVYVTWKLSAINSPGKCFSIRMKGSH